MAYLFSNHSFSPPTFQDEAAYPNVEDHYEEWKYKFIDYWSSYDTLFWLLSELYKLQVQNPATLKLEHFVHTRGCDLKSFTLEDFRKIIPQYGDMLYYQLKTKLRNMTEEVWRREMTGHMTPSPGSSSGHEHFNTSYFDQPIFPPPPPPPPPPPTHHSAASSSASDKAPKHWPPDRREYECWAYKSVMEWTPSDTLDCIVHELFQMNINPANVNLDNVREIYGRNLIKMTLEDFKWMLPDYGELLYHKLQPKVKACLESEMPWKGTHDSRVFSNQNISQPVSFAHRRELPYAHPSCFRWKPEGLFPGRSPHDDSVLNLSREHTSTSTSVLNSNDMTLEGTSHEIQGRHFSSFDQSPSYSRSHSSISKSNFSILSLTKDSGGSTSVTVSLTKDSGGSTSVTVKQEKESVPPLSIALPIKTHLMKKLNQELESAKSQCTQIKDSESRDICSVDTSINTQDSVKAPEVSTTDSTQIKGVGSCIENSVLDHGYNSNSETNDEMPVDQEKKKEKRRPGRPRSLSKKDKAKGKVGRVWEFIRDLIMDPKYNPSIISWEDRDKGLFRFRSGDQVAKLWGCKRGNPRMNFENFSRSIRQNYKKGYLLPVEKIRLVYQFGPRSTGWRPGDPPTRPVTLPSAPAVKTTPVPPSADNTAQ